MKNKKLYITFIIAFLLLYLIIACISFVHSIGFFSIGNAHWMAVLLGFSFELGQAVVLASILLSDNKKSLLTWLIFIVLTAVQCIGNVYSVYKFMSLSDIEYYRFLQEPLLFWLQGVDEQMVKVIISWITGALLPIVALGMTGMVASNIQMVKKTENEKVDEPINGPINEPINEFKDEPYVTSSVWPKLNTPKQPESLLKVENPKPKVEEKPIEQQKNSIEQPVEKHKESKLSDFSRMIFRPVKKEEN